MHHARHVLKGAIKLASRWPAGGACQRMDSGLIHVARLCGSEGPHHMRRAPDILITQPGNAVTHPGDTGATVYADKRPVVALAR
jgi:hypothetical protein